MQYPERSLGEQRAIFQRLAGLMRRRKSKGHPRPGALNRDGIRRNPEGGQGILGPFVEFGFSARCRPQASPTSFRYRW
jgi:hypothetical protein